ncbi:MAG: hypothetical protein R2991_02175 [Thermoanaerobaculia bacterium]
MPRFERYIGIRYSGRKEPTAPLSELRVFAAREDREVYQEFDERSKDGTWSRRNLAEWLAADLAGTSPTIVTLDHAFSFPRTYLDRHGLSSWEEFLGDFETHWPTQDNPVGELLPGNLRRGSSDERRLTGKWASSQTGGVFRFETKDGQAAATHAALPWLDYVRRAVPDLHVWPFDGFQVPDGVSVAAEAHATRLLLRYPNASLSREEQEAFAVCSWLQDRDRNDLLVPYFDPPLTDAERTQALLEGWILGVA